MPIMDGFECVTRFRKWEAEHSVRVRQHICCLTAQPSDSVRRDCQEAGMDGLIAKPMKKIDLIDYLQSV